MNNEENEERGYNATPNWRSLDYIQEILSNKNKKGKKINKSKKFFDHFKKLNILLSIYIAIIGLFGGILKIAENAYMHGRLSVYGINYIHIELQTNNFLYEVIKLILLGSALFFSNFISYIIWRKGSIEVCTTKQKLFVIKKIGLNILEFIAILIIFSIVVVTTIDNEIGRNSSNLTYGEIFKVIAFVVISLTVMFQFSGWIYAFLESRPSTSKEDSNEKDNNKDSNKKDTSKYNRKITTAFIVIGLLFFLASYLFVIMWISGKSNAKNKVAYKIIQVGDSYYPIVHETKDKYFLSRLVKHENQEKNMLDTSYLKIISNQDIETISVNNIHDIKVMENLSE